MADNPSPSLTFPGLPPVVGGRWTVSRGVLPSVCLAETLRRPVTGASGTLVLSQGDVATAASGAAVAECRPRKFTRGGEGFRWIAQIVDRRASWWRWVVYGEWNKRLPDGTIPTGRKKNARELATLLFEGVGEAGFDVGDVPADVWPYVNWEGVAAPLALQSLANTLGFEIAYNPFTDKAGMVKPGVGGNLPGGGKITPDADYQRSSVPHKLQLVGGPTVYQFLFELEPVGPETNGRIRAIDDLTYKPSAGWEGQWPTMFADVAQANRHLAFEGVYRWWRVKAFADGTLDAPGFGELDSIDQCLPLLPHLLQTGNDDDNVPRTLPPKLEGTFWPGSLIGVNTKDHTVYSGPFTLDCENGLVKLPQPLVRFVSNQPKAAKLYLLAACRIRTDNGAYERYASDEVVNPNGTGTQPLTRDELFLSYRNVYTDGAVSDDETNQDALDAEAESWLTARGAEFGFTDRSCETFRGIRNVAPDGRIGQVRFVWGQHRAETTASVGYEFDAQEPGRDERMALVRSLSERYA